MFHGNYLLSSILPASTNLDTAFTNRLHQANQTEKIHKLNMYMV